VGFGCEQVAQCRQHVFECVGRVGVVDHGGYQSGGVGNVIEAASGGGEAAEGHQYFVALLPQLHGDAEGGDEVVSIEATDEAGEDFRSVQLKLQALGGVGEYFSAVIHQLAEAVFQLARPGVL